MTIEMDSSILIENVFCLERMRKGPDLPDSFKSLINNHNGILCNALERFDIDEDLLISHLDLLTHMEEEETSGFLLHARLAEPEGFAFDDHGEYLGHCDSKTKFHSNIFWGASIDDCMSQADSWGRNALTAMM